MEAVAADPEDGRDRSDSRDNPRRDCKPDRVRQITGKPIKFMGVGEKSSALEPFHPDRMASQILGMGDVLGLIARAEETVERDQAEELAKQAMRRDRDAAEKRGRAT